MSRTLRVAALLPLALVSLLAPAQAQARRQEVQPTEHPFLWVIEGEKPSYLYGTIHLPDERVLALPQAVEDALTACDALYTEIPMDMGTQMGMMNRVMLPGRQTLRDVLPADLYERTNAYLRTKGLSIQPFNRMKVWVLSTQLGLLDYMAQMATRQPLDAMVYARAQRARKEVGGLETVEEQLNVFESLTTDEQVHMLRQTLDGLEGLDPAAPSPVEQMIVAYLAGDEDALARQSFEEMDPNDPVNQRFMQLILTDRNVRMADRIAERVRANPGRSYFFAVGSLHYPGEQGIVALLRARGFTITRVGAPEATQPDAPAAAPPPAPDGGGRRFF